MRLHNRAITAQVPDEYLGTLANRIFNHVNSVLGKSGVEHGSYMHGSIFVWIPRLDALKEIRQLLDQLLGGTALDDDSLRRHARLARL